MMITDKWETLEEIRKRTGQPAEVVRDAVKFLFRTGKADLRSNWRDRTEFKLKEKKL